MNNPVETVPSLESVLSTGELNARPSRPPDYETENRALLAILQQMAESPRTALQKLAEVALEVCRAGSAGVSLLSEDELRFHWPAIAGAWKPQIGNGTPRDFGPCGVVLDRDATQLFTRPERYYPYLVPVSPPIEEALLTPFRIEGKAMGTVWVVAHDPARKFDAEDVRLIQSLSRLAAAAYPLYAVLDAQKQSQSLRDINQELLVASVRQHEQARNSEAALRESEERFRTLVSVITDVPWTTSADGEFVAPQSAWTMYTGQSWEKQRGFGWANAIHPDDRPRVLELWLRACQERTLYESQGRIWHAGTHQYRYFQARATPVRNPAGSVREWVGACTDINEQKRFETDLQTVNSDLKHFSYAASHDLQEPLRMVTSYTQLLARTYKGKLGPEADRYIAFAVDGAKRMETLLRSLREYWSVKDQHVESLVPIDCNRILDKALMDLEVPIRESGAVVTRDFLPTVMAEDLPMTLLFQNLIGNAIKYRRPDAPLRIHLAAQQGPLEWQISVSDNGIGIPAEYLKGIFAPFKRLHGKEHPGSGLGLALCQKAVERYRGRIWVESIYGQGSTFHFTIPSR